MQKNKYFQRLKKLLALGILTCVGGLTAVTQAQINVGVDSTKSWQGYVNVYSTANGYLWGSAWGVADLTSVFIPGSGGWPLNTALVMKPNTNQYHPADPYWTNPDGTPNKVMEANTYVDVGTNYGGQTVTFSGTIISNSLPLAAPGLPVTGWEVLAVVKEFGPGYSWVGMSSVPLTGPGSFTVSRAIPVGGISQYGFIVKGPNIAPGSADSFKGVGVEVHDADPAIMTQPANLTQVAGVTVNMSVSAIGSGLLAYEWKKDGASLQNGAKYAGVNTPTLTIANSQASDSGGYVVTVSNTVTHATLDSRTAQLTILDVLVTTAPVNQRVEQGSTVTFEVVATSSSSISYQWKSEIGGVVTTLANGPTVSGATTPTLTLSNVQPANSGRYFVVLTTSSGAGEASANLLVKTYADFSNVLENPGFEADPTGASPAPWNRFEITEEGAFGQLQTVNNTYWGGGNVDVLEGTFVSYTTFQGGGGYYGIFQDVSAQPGQVFTADMSFYNPTGDPLPGPDSTPPATNQNYLEIQFRGVGTETGTPIQQYISSFMDHTMVRDTWTTLQATNAGGYGTMPPTSNARYLVAPPGTTFVRFQVTMHDMGGSSDALGSLYYDSAKFMLKLPVTVTAEKSGSNVTLSWKSQGATSYQVQYTDTLGGTWQNLGTEVSGTGQMITKGDSVSGSQRYYRVLTL